MNTYEIVRTALQYSPVHVIINLWCVLNGNTMRNESAQDSDDNEKTK